MLRLLCLPSLLLVAVLAFDSEKIEETVISEQDVEEWFSDQELSLFGKEFIVQGRTIARDDEGKGIETWMKIEHVFYGPAFLKGQQFRVVSPKQSEFSGPFSVYPAPDINDVGIWRLEVRENRLVAFPRNPFFGAPIPAFQKDGDDYKTAISFSKAIEELSKLPDRQKQLSRLKQLALSQESEIIAYWATGVIARVKPDGIVDFLRKVIANEKSTVAAQVVADKALMELDQKAWQHSNERIAMVENWVHGKSSLRAALSFSGGLSDMRRESFGIDKRKFLKFLSVVLLNEEIPSDERLGIVHGFRDYPKQFKDDAAFQDEVFLVFANVVVKSKNQAVKLEAARTLATAFSLESQMRQTKLRELMESEESGEGGRFLRDKFDIDAIE